MWNEKAEAKKGRGNLSKGKIRKVKGQGRRKGSGIREKEGLEIELWKEREGRTGNLSEGRLGKEQSKENKRRNESKKEGRTKQ